MRGTVVKRINRELLRMRVPPTDYKLHRNHKGAPACIMATGYRAWRKAMKKSWRGLTRTAKRHAGKGNIPEKLLRAVSGGQGPGGAK